MTEKEILELIKNPGLMDISINNLDNKGLKIDIIGNTKRFFLIFW